MAQRYELFSRLSQLRLKKIHIIKNLSLLPTMLFTLNLNQGQTAEVILCDM